MRQRRVVSLALAGLGLILFGAAIWLLLAGNRFGPAARSTDFTAVPVAVDFDAPSLRLTDVNGFEHALSDYAGQVVLVNLWATWCPPCQAEMPNLQRFYTRHKQDGFTLIAVNDGEPSGDVLSFVSRYGLSFPVWLDPTFQATDHAFKTANLPTSYVIDRQGKVRLMWIGAISESNLDRHVASIIKE